MKTQNLMSRSFKPANRITIQDLSTGLIELSEKDLQHIVGGCCCCCCCGGGGGGGKKTLGDYIDAIIDALF